MDYTDTSYKQTRRDEKRKSPYRIPGVRQIDINKGSDSRIRGKATGIKRNKNTSRARTARR